MKTNYETLNLTAGQPADFNVFTYEKKQQLSNNYDRLTGINIKVALLDGATVEMDDEALLFSLADRADSSIVKELFTGFANPSSSLELNQRFFPLDLDAKNNEITLSFKGTKLGVDHDNKIVQIMVTLRYETN